MSAESRWQAPAGGGWWRVSAPAAPAPAARPDGGGWVPTDEIGAYWLRQAHGFTVLAGRARLGVVEDVLLSGDGCLEALLVAAGVLRLRSLVVVPAEILDVTPRHREVRIRPMQIPLPGI